MLINISVALCYIYVADYSFDDASKTIRQLDILCILLLINLLYY